MGAKTLTGKIIERDELYPTNGDGKGWIQWKGTDVCIDLHCDCGHHGHFDGWFLYYYKCPDCGAKYGVGASVTLHRLSESEAKEVSEFQTVEL